MSYTLARFTVMAALGMATLFAVADDASAGHRHRRAKNNNACCCPAPVVTTSACNSGCGYSGSSDVGYPGNYYPYSGQTTVSNRNYSTSGSSMYYPNGGYQSGNYYASPGYDNAYGNAYGSNNYGGNVNSNVRTGAGVGAAVGQAVGGNSGAAVGAAIGAAAGAR